MRSLLVRHASAGRREDWQGDDRLRPLDARGWKQAEAIAELLADRVDQLVSSPSVRCVQTLEPLAARTGLPIERSDALAEGAGGDEAYALLAGVQRASVVLCTHGDVIEGLLGEPMKKGSVLELDFDGRRLKRLRRLRPPA